MSTPKQHYQRRFLLDGLPAELKLSDRHLQITEFLPESDEFLIRRVRDTRSRSVNTCLEFTTVMEKSGIVALNVGTEEVDNSTVETRIGVNDYVEIRFNRYQSETRDVKMFVDVFLGNLNRGVITATIMSESAVELLDVNFANSVELAPYYNYRLIIENKAGIRGEKR